MKSLQPDKITRQNEEERNKNKEKFKQILTAYTALLKEEIARKEDENYDDEEDEDGESEEINYAFTQINFVTVYLQSVVI